jgi:glycosidase
MLISKKAREQFKIKPSFFKETGGITFPDFQAIRTFTETLKEPEARAGHINAMGLMHEIFLHVIERYKIQENPVVLQEALEFLEKNIGKDSLDKTLILFIQEFPPAKVYTGDMSIQDYLTGTSKGIPNRQHILEELLILWLDNKNPAQETYKKILFDDTILSEKSTYSGIIEQLERYFQTQPLFGPKNKNIIAMLRSPAVAIPDSLTGQLNYIRDNWGPLLADLLKELLSGLDMIKEEEKFGGHGPGEIPVYDFSKSILGEEYERFTADLHWMPRLVMIAKSTHVWLDQLSKKYKTHIYRLDQIPDEELDILVEQGFTGLWLIGLWERSQASETIKKICGNPEAMASAYSISEYRIADNLGGEGAVQNLKQRAWQRGIRLASDMVPNHMGIDSPWLVEHPDWFLSLDYCPYPAYSFTGTDLSVDSRISIYLEDHYYDRTDAAVVFKWLNNQTGDVRYIYHGNDGTSMPWNDTAQLNYLNPDVREAVANTIFSVAQKFPIIRFDAAMTLTQKHFQRLWFPEPGSGGDIPTRAGKGLATEEFLQHMPKEFWRQVVDRFSESSSDTLLLAEAFWMMETYFVRTLGMHRVYNSAFMNFLKNEHNDQFRTSIKNVLQFNREILKRFVNFLNNPDEETAVAQFGKEDKYFGVTTLMATLPGLPMFGHGQIEGFSEKYGMEYRRAYKDETLDLELLERHKREIFPLLRKRYLFAEVEHFLFYDFYSAEGYINENVIAYSNRWEKESSLVLYHNVFAETVGWVKTSVPYTTKTGETTGQMSLAEGLSLSNDVGAYVIFKDNDSNLEYLRNCRELHQQGLYVELKAFKKHVFLDFREVRDSEDGIYTKLADILSGSGVSSIRETLRQRLMNPLKESFQNLVRPILFKDLQAAKIETIAANLEVFLTAVKSLTETKGSNAKIAIEEIVKATSLKLGTLQDKKGKSNESAEAAMFKPAYMIWLLLKATEQAMDICDDSGDELWQLLEEWLLVEDIEAFLIGWEATQEIAMQMTSLIKCTLHYRQWQGLLKSMPRGELKTMEQGKHQETFIHAFFDDPDVRRIFKVNRHQDVLWFNKEAAETWFHWLWFLFESGQQESLFSMPELLALLEESKYNLEKFKEKLVIYFQS